MKLKRIIGTIIIKEGIAVQAFGFSKYLPLGKPEYLAENLEKWEADEIVILEIDRKGKGPNINLLLKIANAVHGTPLIYGGGIASHEDAVQVINNGAERVILNSLLLQPNNILEKIIEKIGKQALIASIPFKIQEKNFLHYRYDTKKFMEIEDSLLCNIKSGFFSELFLMNKDEGGVSLFPVDILNYLKQLKIETPIIPFGSIEEINDMRNLLIQDQISAIAIGNSLNYKENNIPYIKDNLKDLSIRTLLF